MIEDSPSDAALFEVALRESVLASAMIEHEKSLSSGLLRLRETSFDGVVLDLGLPDSDGLDTFVRVSEAAGAAAIVVVSGRDDARLAEEAVRLGAQDYLLKNEPRTGEFGRAVDYAIRRQRLLGELERARDEQLAAKDRFLTHVSHELRSPLSVVHQFATLLLDGVPSKPSAEQSELLTVLIRNVGQLKFMIEPVERQPVSTWSAHDSHPAGGNTRPVGPGTHAHVTVDDLPPIFGNPTELAQLFQNLIANAIKFSQPDVVPEIHVSARQIDGQTRFAVSDNGIGIDARHQERIFGMFKRLHGRDAYPGTGIGLALCKKIVERHQGAIGVGQGPQGVGSTFWFTIPTVSEMSP